MALSLSEIEMFIKSLNTANSWDNSTLNKSSESYLRRALTAPVRSVYSDQICLAYHVDLRKELDPDFKECIVFLIRLLDDLAPRHLNELIDAMRHTILKEGLAGQPHVIFFFGESMIQKSVIEDELWGNIILHSGNVLKLLSSISPRKQIIESLRKHKSKMMICPFHYLGPCSPEMFVGRKRLIRDILSGPHTGYAIAGSRRIGKSSLLFKLQSEIRKGIISKNIQEFHPLYIDCSTFSSFKDLMKEMVRRLFPSYYSKGSRSKIDFTFKHLLGRVKGLSGKPLFLLLDEMDPLVEKAQQKYDEDTKLFFDSLRAEGNSGALKLVIAGFRQVSKMIADASHPFYNVCEKMRLKPLESKTEVHELIARNLFMRAIRLEQEDEIISQIYHSTAGHPSVVQFIGRQLFYNRSGNVITTDDLSKVVESEELIELLLDNFALNADELEMLICLSMLEIDEITIATVLDIFEQEGINISNLPGKVYLALRSLSHNNILESEKERYRFLHPLMRDIIKDYFYAPQVYNSLKRGVIRGSV